jgi:prepilin-type N-terminal cleavage/methylation domain-containing protein
MAKVKQGFTLIELLIVVAIIAILAAIAIPNFLAAQVRSKVSRAKSELRTVAMALESFYVDNNGYPATTVYPEPDGIIPVSISTPIAYLSSARPYDPFKQPGTDPDQQIYTYHNLTTYSATYRNAYGDWRMCCIGPDAEYWNTQPRVMDWRHIIEYDPTNGTVSLGNIWRSQKHPDAYEWRP